MPEHGHLEARHVDGRLYSLQHRAGAHQTRRHHRHEIGAGQNRDHEQEMRHGKRHPARQSRFCEHLIRGTAKSPAVRRDDHVLEIAELCKRRRPFQAWMIDAACQNISLRKEHPTAQSGRGSLTGMKGEIDCALFRLPGDA